MIKTYDAGVETKYLNKIVKLMKEKEPDIISRMKNIWEKELALSILDTEWKLICKNIHQTSSSNYWKEFSWKIINRYFKTPHI